MREHWVKSLRRYKVHLIFKSSGGRRLGRSTIDFTGELLKDGSDVVDACKICDNE